MKDRWKKLYNNNIHNDVVCAGNRRNQDIYKVTLLDQLIQENLNICSKEHKQIQLTTSENSLEVISGRSEEEVCIDHKEALRSRAKNYSEISNHTETYCETRIDCQTVMEGLEEEMHELCKREKLADKKLEYVERFKRKVERKRRKVEHKENLVKNVTITQLSSDSEDENINKSTKKFKNITYDRNKTQVSNKVNIK